MNLSKRVKISAGAFAAIGLVAAGGAAFTSTGVTTTGQAASAQVIGGTITQSVTGATLSSIVYGYTDATNTAINQVTLTFANANADGLTAAIAFTTDAGGTPVAFTCENVGATTTMVSTCLPTATGTSQTLTASIAVTIGSTNAS